MYKAREEDAASVSGLGEGGCGECVQVNCERAVKPVADAYGCTGTLWANSQARGRYIRVHRYTMSKQSGPRRVHAGTLVHYE